MRCAHELTLLNTAELAGMKAREVKLAIQVSIVQACAQAVV